METTELAPTPTSERPARTLVCAPPPAGHVPHVAAATDAHDPLERMRLSAAAFFHRQHVGPDALIGAAFALAALGAFVLLAAHPGLGALLGLLSLLFPPLATVRPSWPYRKTDVVRHLAPLCDLLLLAGFLGGIASVHPPFTVGLAMTVVVLVAWLPSVEPRRLGVPAPGGLGLWRRPEQMAVLLLGAFLARPVPALLALLLVGGADAWLRAAPPHSLVSGRSWARRLFLPDGALHPAARWGSLGAVVLALFLFPRAALWRV